MARTTAEVAALDTPVEVLEISTPGNYQAKVDVSELVAGDELVIRGYQKTDAGPARYFATVRVNYDVAINGDPDADTLYVPLPWTIEDGQAVGIELTMTQVTTALPRSFDCSMTNLGTFE